jgi:branched-chain amino acid transport system permease protein
MGVYGRWLKIKAWFQLFPMARRDMFRRHKSYLKTERMR